MSRIAYQVEIELSDITSITCYKVGKVSELVERIVSEETIETNDTYVKSICLSPRKSIT